MWNAFVVKKAISKELWEKRNVKIMKQQKTVVLRKLLQFFATVNCTFNKEMVDLKMLCVSVFCNEKSVWMAEYRKYNGDIVSWILIFFPALEA